jgi:hypothetical protein
MTINEFIFYLESPIVKVLTTILVILISGIFFSFKIPRYLKRIDYWLSNYYYKLYSKQIVKTDIEKILKQSSIAVSIYDEMIGFFKATHVGIYSFHNGNIALDNTHLYKITMIDERSRHYSLIRHNKDISANIVFEIINHCKSNDYYLLDKNETNIIFIKEQLSVLDDINYIYYSIHWEEQIPSFGIAISTKYKIREEDLIGISKYRTILHQIYNKKLETNTHSLIVR